MGWNGFENVADFKTNLTVVENSSTSTGYKVSDVIAVIFNFFKSSCWQSYLSEVEAKQWQHIIFLGGAKI